MTDSNNPDDIKPAGNKDSSLADEPTVLLETTADHSKQHTSHGALAGDLLPGTRINRIVIEQLIGKGGMGAVYLAFDEKLQRQIALKSIRPEFLANLDTQQRFIREARILSKINHQSICHIYDYIESQSGEALDGAPAGDFLVLEYIKGRQLYQVSLNEAEILDALIALAEALAVAHEHGVIHRDLKPDNVMISDAGQLKVLDFGIAQSMPSLKNQRADLKSHISDSELRTDLTQQGSLVGTIRYMSPEQAKGEVLTTASDIYALGVMAQELWGKTPAYAVMETAELLSDVQSGRRVDCLTLSTDQQELISQLTALDAQKRPDALQSVALFKSLKQAPQLKKKKRVRTLVSVISLFVVCLLLWQWYSFTSQQEQTERFNSYTTSINELVKASEQIYALPIHDVRPEIAQIYAKSAVLFQKIQLDDVLNEKQKSHLHGVIFLKSEAYSLATKKLTEGQAGSDLLASAWIGLYIEKVSAYSEIHGYIRAVQSKEIQTEFLKPALKYVQLAVEEASLAGLSQNNLHKAFLLAHVQGMPAALSLLDEVGAEQKWNNEVIKLKALLLATMSMDYREKGQWDAAHATLLDTASTYRQATEMARSFPYNYQSLCATEISLMSDALSRTGRGFEIHAENAVKACEAYLLTEPDSVGAQNQLSLSYLLMASWQIVHGQPSQQAIDQANSWNQKSQANLNTLFGKKISAYIRVIEAAKLEAEGLSADEPLNQALIIFEQLVPGDKQLNIHQAKDLLFVHNVLISQRLRKMEDFSDLFQQAEKYYASAIQNEPLLIENHKELLVNMSQIYLYKLLNLKYKKVDISGMTQRYLPFFENSIATLKHEPNTLINYAHIQLLLAESSQPTDVSSHVAIASNMVEQALLVNNSSQVVLLAQALVMNWQAILQLSSFEFADLAFAKAVDVNPEWAGAYHMWAEAKLNQARFSTSKELRIQAIQAGLDLMATAKVKDPLNQTFVVTETSLQQMLVAESDNESQKN